MRGLIFDAGGGASIDQADPRIDTAFVRFPANAYEIKSIADYGAEPQANVSMADANETIKTAGGMIACIANLPESDDAAET